LYNFSISEISWLEGYKVEIRKIIYLQVLDLSGESSYPKGTFGRDLWVISSCMPGNFATTWNPIFKPPPCFSQDFLNTPRIHLQNSKSEQAKKVYAMCIAEWPKLWRRYIPMYPGLMTKKIIFLGEIHKDPHKKCLQKFVCKWISLLIPRSLNYKLTVNLKNFTNFHESYKSVTNLFFGKKGSLPFL
jgi:hypothetical protein